MKTVFLSDLKKSIKAVWIILSLLTFIVLILSVFFPDLLMEVSPACLSKTISGRECFMCGTTRAFTEFGQGNFKEGIELNRLSIILFFALIINIIVFFAFIIKKLIAKFKK